MPIMKINVDENGVFSTTYNHFHFTHWIPCTDYLIYLTSSKCTLSPEGEITEFHLELLKSPPCRVYPFGIVSSEKVGTLNPNQLIGSSSIQLDPKTNLYYFDYTGDETVISV